MLDSRPEASVGFVPTMGALHQGHLSLVAAAHARNDVVVLSIFVNPLQFGPGEDYERYPRSEQRDLDLARAAGVDIVILPTVAEIYPEGATTTIDPGDVALPLEGAARPGHFRGVATVVAKLFNIVRPREAFFGQKDAQQVAVIKRMVRDLLMPVHIVVCPTAREPDGLALSSRNAYLSDMDRVKALALKRALDAGESTLSTSGDVVQARAAMWEVLSAAEGVSAEYAEVVDPDTFGEVRRGGAILLVVAARVGGTRLIDNVLIGQGDGAVHLQAETG